MSRRYLESQEQRLFVKRFRMDPRTKMLAACAIPNAGRRSPVTAGILKAEGMEAGVPDWFLFHPGLGLDDGEHVGLALEFKSPTGKGRVSREQRSWHLELSYSGWRVEIVTSSEQAWDVVCNYLRINL